MISTFSEYYSYVFFSETEMQFLYTEMAVTKYLD